MQRRVLSLHYQVQLVYLLPAIAHYLNARYQAMTIHFALVTNVHVVAQDYREFVQHYVAALIQALSFVAAA